jgi:hypothetical protein
MKFVKNSVRHENCNERRSLQYDRGCRNPVSVSIGELHESSAFSQSARRNEMKRLSIVLLLVMVGAALLGVLGVNAQEGAVVINDHYCFLVDANGDLFFVGDAGHIVVTPSGNHKISCQTQQPASVANPSSAVHWDYESTGFPCYFPDGAVTYNWKAVVTPSGNVNLSCHLN